MHVIRQSQRLDVNGGTVRKIAGVTALCVADVLDHRASRCQEHRGLERDLDRADLAIEQVPGDCAMLMRPVDRVAPYRKVGLRHD